MRQTDIVVGGGIAGLVSALLLAEKKNNHVILVERESQPGGLLRHFDYGKYGVFDYGMHNMYETGIAELDELLFGLLPEDQWQILEGKKRDLAGVVFNGKAQLNSPFPDLRLLPYDQWSDCIAGFFRQLDEGRDFGSDNAWDDACSRFGIEIATIIDTALQKQFGVPAKKLAPFASQLTTLSRVVLFGEQSFGDLIQSPVLRERLAWPEQRSLPDQWESGRKSYYPKQYGIYRVIDALLTRLQAAGVEVLTNSQLSSVEVSGKRVNKIVISSQENVREIDDLDSLVWTSGIPPIALQLGLDLSGYAFDPPRKTVVVNLLLSRPPAMDDLYYLYCYEPGCHTFRITNFTGYCEGAPRAGGWPVSVELLLDAPLPDEPEMLATTLDELERFGVIAGVKDVLFSKVEPLANGFPMPTINNFEVLADVRNRITALGLSNLTLLGILSEENIFFQRDVLAQTWNRLSETVNKNE